MKWRLPLSMTAILGVLVPSLPAGAQFVEIEVEVVERFDGDQVGDYFGWVCTSIEDVTGDGVRELLIPAILRDGNRGRVTVYSGRDGAVLGVVEGEGAGQLFGYALGEAGDVDGDGVVDWIAGGGIVRVISGADFNTLLTLEATTGFGHSVAGAGDLDGDGRADLIVGSERTFEPPSTAGELFALSGADGSVLWKREGEPDDLLGSGVGSVGDVSGDGVADVVASARGAKEAYILSGRDGSLIHTLRPVDPSLSAEYGRFFASGAGDVNGDGVGDAFLADYSADEGRGEVYVYSGRTGEIVRFMRGVDAGDGFGPGRGIPDVNGDGHADLFIAAYADSDGAAGAGKAYLYSGRSGALLRTMTSTVEGFNFGVDAIATGDINGDELTDYLVTAVGPAFGGVGPGSALLIAGEPLPCPADLNDNGWVGFADLVHLLRLIRQGDLEGDLNGDRVIDPKDMRVLLKDLGRCSAEP